MLVRDACERLFLLAEVSLVPLWCEGHILATEALLPNKPLVLEEFGKIASTTPADVVRSIQA